MIEKPTPQTYGALQEAYDFFNEKLFDSRLPDCLITVQRKKNVYGYFSPDRWGQGGQKQSTDEIALNPQHFKERTLAQILSTLAHEMCHLQQHHFGKISRGGYHNRQWAELMKKIGLQPSDTGAPGGKETGQRVSHYIIEGKAFHRACMELEARGFVLPFYDKVEDLPNAAKKRASKTKFTCPDCQANAWGKEELFIICGDCEEKMI